jgi:hypothetical protein
LPVFSSCTLLKSPSASNPVPSSDLEKGLNSVLALVFVFFRFSQTKQACVVVVVIEQKRLLGGVSNWSKVGLFAAD